MSEELDYHLEARNQRHFANAFRDDEDVLVPDVLVDSTHVLVTEWVDGTPLARIIAYGTQEQRDEAATLYLEFLLRAPNRARLLHADPHPGNFRITDDGRLAVFDFGAVNRLPDGLPASIGRVLTEALAGDARALEAGLRREGFIRKGIDIDPEALLELPHAARRAAAPRAVHLRAGVAARRGGDAPGPPPPAVPRRAQAQPAPGVPPHPPGLARRHRRAQPDRGHRAAARAGLRAPARHRRVTAAAAPALTAGAHGHHQAESSLPSMLRRWGRLQVSQVHTSRPFSTPRAQVIRARAAASSSAGTAPHVAHTGRGADAGDSASVVCARRAHRAQPSALRGRLGGLLEVAHLLQRLGVDDVGHRAVRPGLGVGAAGLLPALGSDAELLAEQGGEDPRLLLAEAGQRLEPADQLGAGGRVAPEGRRRRRRRCRARWRPAPGCARPSSVRSGGWPAGWRTGRRRPRGRPSAIDAGGRGCRTVRAPSPARRRPAPSGTAGRAASRSRRANGSSERTRSAVGSWAIVSEPWPQGSQHAWPPRRARSRAR